MQIKNVVIKALNVPNATSYSGSGTTLAIVSYKNGIAKGKYILS